MVVRWLVFLHKAKTRKRVVVGVVANGNTKVAFLSKSDREEQIVQPERRTVIIIMLIYCKVLG